MSRYLTTPAVTLWHRPWREHDRTYSLLCRRLGKIDAIAAGSQKLVSKLAGQLEPFGVVLVTMVQRGATFKVTGALCRQRLLPLGESAAHLTAAIRCVRVIDQVVLPGVAEPAIFALVVDVLRAVAMWPVRGVTAASSFFTLKLLTLLGYRPEVMRCLECRGELLPHGNQFDPGRGGLVCARCWGGTAGVDRLPVSPTAIKLLRAAVARPWPELARLAFSPEAAAEFTSVVDRFLAYHHDEEIHRRRSAPPPTTVQKT